MERVAIPDHPGFFRRGRWVVFSYRDRRGRQHWAKARNVTEAKRLKAELITDVHRGEYRPRSRLSFEAYALEWLDAYQGRTSKAIEPSTRANYRRRLEQEAIPFFKGMLLSEIEPSDIKAFCAQVAARVPVCRRCKDDPDRRRGCEGCGGTGRRGDVVSPETVRLALAPVKVLLATAFEDGVIRVNPAAGVRVLQPQPPGVYEDDDHAGAVKALTVDELGQLLAALEAKEPWRRWSLFFRVLLELGLRIGEMIELRWRDVDLAARTVRVRRKYSEGKVGPPKSKYGRRTLRLTPELAAELWRLRKETRGRDGDLVFTAAHGGRVHPSNLMRRVLKPAAIAAGVGEWVGFHTFRHTCATLLFTKAGWNPKQVQLWLGHHSASFTVDRYIHLLPSDLPAPTSLAPAATATVGNEAGNTITETDPNTNGADQAGNAALTR